MPPNIVGSDGAYVGPESYIIGEDDDNSDYFDDDGEALFKEEDLARHRVMELSDI